MKKIILIALLVVGSLVAASMMGEKGFCLNCLYDGNCYNDSICGSWCFCYMPQGTFTGKCIPK